MTDFDNETTVEVTQVCPKLSFSEILRAFILFSLLFGMIALASIPLGTLPALVLLDSQENTPPPPARNGDPPAKLKSAPEEQVFPGRFVMEGQTSAQNIQATVALPPAIENALPYRDNRPPLDDNSGATRVASMASGGATSDDPRSFGLCLHHEVTPSSAIQSVQPLDGVTSSGFTSWDYQTTSEVGGQRPYAIAGPNGTSGNGSDVEMIPPRQASSLPPYRGGQPTLRDWASRFEKIGAVRYRLETWGNQAELYRFWCEMPVGQSTGAVRFFEAVASRPEEAMENVLRQVEQWLQDVSSFRP